MPQLRTARVAETFPASNSNSKQILEEAQSYTLPVFTGWSFYW